MISNFVKSARSIVAGTHLATIGSFYDPRFPPTKFFFSRVASKTRVRCVLCGFPRTGTHWIRNVIQRSTGLSDYAVAAKGPFPVDSNSDGILVKIHARNKTLARIKALWLLPRHDFDGKYIYTYRDPRDAILSLYEMYKHRKGLPDLGQDAFLKRYDPIGQFKWEIRAWVMREHRDVLRVRYEDLKHDPRSEFERIFRYLELEGDVSEDSLREAVANADGSHRPRRTAYGWKNAPEQYQPLINSVSARLGKEIRALGYEI